MEINTKISTDEISNDDDGSSSCTNIDQLIENFEWLVMIISLGEEEIRFAQHYEYNLLHSEHSRTDSNGESLDYSSSNVLRAMGDFLYLLSISFSKLCANINNDNVDQTSFGQRWYRDPQSSDAKKVLMHTFVMIKLYVADKLSPRSSCSSTCAGTIALECLLHILELLLEKDWVIDNEQTLSDKVVSEAVDRRWSMRADAAITFFANITDAVEASLQHALPVINDGFDSAGNLMKQNIRPISEDKQVKIPENVVKSAEIARQASVRAHEASKGVFVGIGQVATKAVNMTAKQVETGSENIDILNSERKDILNATSRVALAGFGAFASISEALFDTSLAIANKAACTTADVVGHRYGESTGKVVEHSADALTNTVRTVKFATSLRKIISHAESVAKNNGKAELEIYKKTRMTMSTDKSFHNENDCSHRSTDENIFE